MCEESWEEIDKDSCIVIKTARHAWISNDPINRKNVHEHCNLAARKRWLHENNILKEKHQGYQYEQFFHMIGTRCGGIITSCISPAHSMKWRYLAEHVIKIGIRSFLKKFYEVITHRDLYTERLLQLRGSPGQLRLVL